MQKRKKGLMKGLGQRLRQLRRQLDLSPGEMAQRMGVQVAAYYKNESGETIPGVTSLHRLHRDFGISMDWLLFDCGPMELKNKTAGNESPPLAELVPTEELELLEHMANDPVIRHEVLLYFYKCRDNKTAAGNNNN